MKATWFRRGMVVLPAALVMACSGDDEAGTPRGEMRVVHANPALGPISVEVGGTTAIENLAQGYTSAPSQVPAGNQNVIVRSGGTVVADFAGNITEGALNSLLVSAAGTQFASEVEPDTGAVAPARANIRMVNVVGPNTSVPYLLEAKLTAPAPDTVMTFGVDTRVARYGTLMYFDPGDFTFRYQPAGDPTVLAEVSFNVAQGETKAVVLSRNEAGDYSASVVVEEE